MRTFTDNNSNKWTLEVTLGDARSIKKHFGLDILDLKEGKALTALADDPILLVDTIWLLVETQAKTKGVTDEQFGRAFNGDVLDEAVEALMGAIVDFFPKSRRAVMEKVLAKSKDLTSQALRRAEDDIDKMTLDQLMDGGILPN